MCVWGVSGWWQVSFLFSPPINCRYCTELHIPGWVVEQFIHSSSPVVLGKLPKLCAFPSCDGWTTTIQPTSTVVSWSENNWGKLCFSQYRTILDVVSLQTVASEVKCVKRKLWVWKAATSSRWKASGKMAGRVAAISAYLGHLLAFPLEFVSL